MERTHNKQTLLIKMSFFAQSNVVKTTSYTTTKLIVGFRINKMSYITSIFDTLINIFDNILAKCLRNEGRKIEKLKNCEKIFLQFPLNCFIMGP